MRAALKPLVALSLVALALGACGDDERSDVLRSTVVVNGYAAINWLDDDTLVIAGDGHINESGNVIKRDSRALFKWDIGKREVEILSPGHSFGGYCLYNGSVYFPFNEGTTAILDVEHAQVSYEPRERPQDHPVLSVIHSRMICRPVVNHAMAGWNWEPLLPEDGLVAFGPKLGVGEKPYNSVSIRREGVIIDLGIDRRDIEPSPQLSYAPFVGKYLLYTGGAHNVEFQKEWVSTNCLKLFVFDRNGRVQKACLQFGPWGLGLQEIRLTKIGIVFASMVNSSGIYLIESGGIKKLSSAMAQRLSISPSGCRIAFHEFRKKDGFQNVAVMRVC